MDLSDPRWNATNVQAQGGTLQTPPDFTFNAAFSFVLQHEGGYVNDPDDPGGETKYGISQKSYPDLEIEQLTEQDAKEIYYRDFWLPSGASVLPFGPASRLLDMAIHLGVRRAVRLLQESLNLGWRFELKVDGICGDKTTFALTQVVEKQSADVLLALLRCAQTAYYLEKLEKSPEVRKYLKGWLRRTL